MLARLRVSGLLRAVGSRRLKDFDEFSIGFAADWSASMDCMAVEVVEVKVSSAHAAEVEAADAQMHVGVKLLQEA